MEVETGQGSAPKELQAKAVRFLRTAMEQYGRKVTGLVEWFGADMLLLRNLEVGDAEPATTYDAEESGP